MPHRGCSLCRGLWSKRMAKRIIGTAVFRSPIRMLLGFLALMSVWIGAPGGRTGVFLRKDLSG